jgi:membrane protease YdiL (CAAX protease family)
MFVAIPSSSPTSRGGFAPRPAHAALACAALALVTAALLPAPLATLLLIAPVVEEIVFRAGLQEALERRLGARAGAAPLANALTACAFAAAHVAVHPGLLAGLTVLPALLVGRVYQVQRRLAPCIALHAVFNAIWWLGLHGSASMPSL